MYPKQDIARVAFSVKARRALWCVASMLLFRPFGTKLLRPWRVLLLRMFGADVAWSAEVYASARIWAPWLLTMGEGSCLGPHTIVYNQARVTLDAGACVSQYAYLCTAGHDPAVPNNPLTGLLVAPIRLGAHAWVGTRAFLGMGVEVGDSAVIGACACIFKDVAPLTIVGGNPAQVLSTVRCSQPASAVITP